MHSLQEVMQNLLNDRKGLCQAIEKDGVICFNYTRYKHGKYCIKHSARWQKNKSFDLPKKEINYCKMVDCNKKCHANGYCINHYRYKWSKNKRHGNAGCKKKCKINQCNEYSYVRGYCNKHYLKAIRYGDPNYQQKRILNSKKRIGLRKHQGCIVPGCDRQDAIKFKIVKGLCTKHYSRWIKFKDYNIASKKEYLLKQEKKK